MVAAGGTVTARDGDTLWAFGHPLFGLGSVRLPAARARVLAIQSLVPEPVQALRRGRAVRHPGRRPAQRRHGPGRAPTRRAAGGGGGPGRGRRRAVAVQGRRAPAALPADGHLPHQRLPHGPRGERRREHGPVDLPGPHGGRSEPGAVAGGPLGRRAGPAVRLRRGGHRPPRRLAAAAPPADVRGGARCGATRSRPGRSSPRPCRPARGAPRRRSSRWRCGSSPTCSPPPASGSCSGSRP